MLTPLRGISTPKSIFFLGLTVFCTLGLSEGWSGQFTPKFNLESQKKVLEIIRKPKSCECLMIDKEIYNVCFYMTQPTILGQTRKALQSLTILISSNKILPGWSDHSDTHFIGTDDLEAEVQAPLIPLIQAQEEEESGFWPSEIAMSYRGKKGESDSKKDSEQDEPIPDEESRDMLEDDAEDDFNSW